MKRRVRQGFQGLKTSVETTELLCGDGNLCAERYGYFETGEGLEPSYTPAPIDKAAGLANASFTNELPELGFALFLNKGGQIFKWNTGDFSTVKSYGVLSSTYPFIVPYSLDGVNVYAVFSGKKVGILKADGQQVVSIPYKLTGGAFYCGRVFAVDADDPFVIRWSGYGLTDWSQSIEGGGYLRLGPQLGKALCITLLEDKLIILRSFGITVFHALGDARHFRLSQSVNLSLPEVTDKTALACRGKLWFFTTGGLCAYDGSSVKIIGLNFFGRTYTCESAKLRFGRYIFAVLNDGGTRSIMEYDVGTGAYAVFARGYNHPFFLGNELYCFSGNSITRLVRGGEDANRVWKSKVLNLGTDRVKTLKNVYIGSESAVRLTVECDGRQRCMTGVGKIYVGECGRNFTLAVNGTDKITRLAAEWEVHA